jgi:hypothetical protein
MLYIFGDSHASRPFMPLKIPHKKLEQSGITMFRIGRDKQIINYNKNFDLKENTIVICYGEVDCRCHIGKQINSGRKEDEVIKELVESYIDTILKNISNSKVIIIAVIPPTSQNEYERKNGPIRDEFPFVNSDEDRVRYTNKVNLLLKEYSEKYNFVFFDPYNYYKNSNGTLKYELSDGSVHIKDVGYFVEQFIQILN